MILDFKLPDISGLEVTQRLLKIDPSLKILILTAETHELTPTWVFAAGAHGYLSKTATPAEFKEALTSILQGHGWEANAFRPGQRLRFLAIYPLEKSKSCG